MEIWKDIQWYEWCYQVSNLGSVKSLSRYKSKIEKILKPWIAKWWYWIVILCVNNNKKTYKVHRLVAQVFLWLDINNPKICVCHKDEIFKNWKLDNSVNNLWLGTHQDNMNDMNNKKRYWWRFKIGIDNRFSKKVNQYTLDWEFIKTWDSTMDIYRKLLIDPSNISRCCNWLRKKAWWFNWEYIDLLSILWTDLVKVIN